MKIIEPKRGKTVYIDFEFGELATQCNAEQSKLFKLLNNLMASSLPFNLFRKYYSNTQTVYTVGVDKDTFELLIKYYSIP